jgi:isopenicillin N synthase-like dioxygenase
MVSGRPHSYAMVAGEIDQLVTRMIHESYGAEKYYDSHVGSSTYLLRMLKNRVPQENEPNLAFVTHTDKSFTTILHQNKVNGLEVETKNGNWITVHFCTPSSFVVMAGDALMVAHFYHLI